MCGIIGFLDRRPASATPLGGVLMSMLRALSCRGPDSVGVAIYDDARPFLTLMIKPPAGNSAETAAPVLAAALKGLAVVAAHSSVGDYVRIDASGDAAPPAALEAAVVAAMPGAEVVSVGRQLMILKQVGGPDRLEAEFGISRMAGRAALGHTRLSTESKVDLSHSQPFWAHGTADLATVHNGHITNYHKMRRRYEQRGVRFWTDNDSEIIGVYLRDRMSAGLGFEDALRSSMDDFDGSFSYLAATEGRLAYVRDRFGFKPLIVAETPDFVAIATEEIALRKALGSGFTAKEPPPGSLKVWSAPVSAPVSAPALQPA